ncbi:MAG: hypothetical protein ACRD1K_11730 [Acidimicrobiales bacterium]
MAAAFSGVGAAGAAETRGYGTSSTNFSLLSLELGKGGSLLNLDVLLDNALSTIDSLVATPNAVSRLAPLSLTSSLLPALNGITAGLPSFESRTPGGQPEVSGSALDFAQGTGNLPLLGALGGVTGLLGGKLIPTKLSSGLDDNGARSALDAALANLSVLNGILSIKSVSNLLGTTAASPAATGDRSVKIDAISLLNLGELLKGLGLDLGNLPLPILNDLLKNLNLLGGLPLAGAPDLLSAVNNLLGVIQPLLTTLTGSTGIVTQIVSQVPVVSSLLGGLPTQLPVLGSSGNLTSVIPTASLLDGTVGNLLGTLQGTLQGLLGGALNLLGNIPLLKLNGADINVATRAGRTLEDSLATAVANVGGLNVLGIELPGVDLAAIGGLVNTVTGLLSSTLGILGLGNLLDVKILGKSTDVGRIGAYNRASATFEVLSVGINPPANLLGLVGGLLNTGKTSSPLALLGSAGVASPAAALPLIGGNMGLLNGLLNPTGLVGALTEGLSLKIGSMVSTSELAAASVADPVSAPVLAAPAPVVAELPRTGADTGTFAAVAAVLAALSLGGRRWNRRRLAS